MKSLVLVLLLISSSALASSRTVSVAYEDVKSWAKLKVAVTNKSWADCKIHFETTESFADVTIKRASVKSWADVTVVEESVTSWADITVAEESVASWADVRVYGTRDLIMAAAACPR